MTRDQAFTAIVRAIAPQTNIMGSEAFANRLLDALAALDLITFIDYQANSDQVEEAARARVQDILDRDTRGTDIPADLSTRGDMKEPPPPLNPQGSAWAGKRQRT